MPEPVTPPNAANPAPVTPAAPVGQTTNLPQVNDVFVHVTYETFQQVARVAAITEEGQTTHVVSYRRFGDGVQKSLSLDRFLISLRPATHEEIQRLAQALPILQQNRTKATLRTVRDAINRLRNSPSGEGQILAPARPPRPFPAPAPVAPAPVPSAPVAEIPSTPAPIPAPVAPAPETPQQPPMCPLPEVPEEFRQPSEEEQVGILTEVTDLDTFDRCILYPETLQEVNDGLRLIEQRASLDRIWNMSTVQPLTGRCVLNFYGAPGTGKTKVAKAIARRLNKKLYVVDYSQIISKYYGDTAKHIKLAFKNAREKDAILFFDEADALMSRRIDMGRDGATSINQNRNVLMQELDRFDGIVIACTNLFKNYDDAILRRISRHVNFKLPNVDMLVQLYMLHIPAQDRVREVDFAVVAKASEGFGGGDVLNACINAMEASSTDPDPNNWYLTQEILLAQIEKIKTAKEAQKPAKKRVGPMPRPVYIVNPNSTQLDSARPVRTEVREGVLDSGASATGIPDGQDDEEHENLTPNSQVSEVHV